MSVCKDQTKSNDGDAHSDACARNTPGDGVRWSDKLASAQTHERAHPFPSGFFFLYFSGKKRTFSDEREGNVGVTRTWVLSGNFEGVAGGKEKRNRKKLHNTHTHTRNLQSNGDKK